MVGIFSITWCSHLFGYTGNSTLCAKYDQMEKLVVIWHE